MPKVTNPNFKWEVLRQTTALPESLAKPLMLKANRLIEVSPRYDLFHKDVPFEFVIAVFKVMQAASWHEFIIVTENVLQAKLFFNSWRRKRKTVIEQKSNNKVIKEALKADLLAIPENVYFAVRVKNQEEADKKVGVLPSIRTSKKIILIKPISERIYLEKNRHWLSHLLKKKTVAIWVIVSGDFSTSNPKPLHPEWVKSIKQECIETETFFSYKGSGRWITNIPAKPDPERLLSINIKGEVIKGRKSGGLSLWVPLFLSKTSKDPGFDLKGKPGRRYY